MLTATRHRPRSHPPPHLRLPFAGHTTAVRTGLLNALRGPRPTAPTVSARAAYGPGVGTRAFLLVCHCYVLLCRLLTLIFIPIFS
jgi:hypothetical protein